MMLSLVIAIVAALAAAPLDRAHAALAQVAAHAEAGGGCKPDELRGAVASAEITKLGTVGDSPVVLAAPHARCMCGAVNCPYYVLQLDAAGPRVLYTTYGWGVETVAAAPLPTLVVRSHDNALVTDETTAAYRSGKYAVVSSVRVRGDSGARKPNAVPIRFAPGASSARLRGSASTGWYDDYVFAARKGQTLVITRSAGTVPLQIITFPADGTGQALTVTPGTPLVLPWTTTYDLEIETSSERDVPYAVDFTIR